MTKQQEMNGLIVLFCIFLGILIPDLRNGLLVSDFLCLLILELIGQRILQITNKS